MFVTLPSDLPWRDDHGLVLSTLSGVVHGRLVAETRGSPPGASQVALTIHGWAEE